MPVKKARINGYYLASDPHLGRVHSIYDPLVEAARLLPENLPADHTYLVLGAGLGYLLKQLANQAPNSRVAVFDPYPELLETGRQLGIWSPDSFSEIKIYNRPDCSLEQLAEFFSLQQSPVYKLIKWPEYIQKKPQFFKRLLQLLKQLQEFQNLNLQTLRRNGRRWLKNFRKNLPGLVNHKQPDFSSIDSGIALIGAGPSLEQQLDWLKLNRTKLTVIAVNTAGPILQNNNLEPDLLVAVDSHPLIYEDLVNSPRCPLLLSPFVDPRIFLKYQQLTPTGMLSFDSPLTGWLQTAPFLPQMRAGGTVTATCAEFFSRLTNSPIYLLGTDMAATAGYYAAGTWRTKKLLQQTSRFEQLGQLHQRWKKVKIPRDPNHSPLTREQRWFESFVCRRTPGRFVIPDPCPDWWKGPRARPKVSGKSAKRLGFVRPPKKLLNNWVKEQYQQLKNLCSGRTVGDDWESFNFWNQQLFEDPENQLLRWENSFADLLSRL